MNNSKSISEHKQDQNQWVKESTFGTWFLSTDTWLNYVLKLAIDDLLSLMKSSDGDYPVIADIGCGHAQSIKLLDEKFHPKKIIGVDIDPNVRTMAAAAIRDCACEVEFKINNAASLELPDESVDLLLCHQTFHHLVDQERAIKEFYRVLKPGGQMLFAESCRRFIHSWVIKVFFRHPMEVQKSADEYIGLIKDAGFIVEAKSVSKPYLWWSRWDFGLLERIGIRPPKDREETMVNLVAQKPT